MQRSHRMGGKLTMTPRWKRGEKRQVGAPKPNENGAQEILEDERYFGPDAKREWKEVKPGTEWTRRWDKDSGRKEGVFRPRRLSVDESQYIAFGITVRLPEVSFVLYPPDPQTQVTYAHLASLDGPPPVGVGDLGKPLLALTLRRVGYDYFMRLHDLSMLLTIGDATGYCDGFGLCPGNFIGEGSPMLFGSPLRERPRLGMSETLELWQRAMPNPEGRVSRAHLKKVLRKDSVMKRASSECSRALAGRRSGRRKPDGARESCRRVARDDR